MKMTYRGVSYEANFPPTDVVEREVTGKYRGQPCHFSYPRHIPTPQPSHTMRYRGLAYTAGEPKTLTEMGVSSTFTQTQATSPPMAIACQLQQEKLGQIHCANLRRILERRRKAAQARGDENLLKMLDLEAQQIAC